MAIHTAIFHKFTPLYYILKYFDSYFASDNLLYEKEYRNGNNQWGKYYNSCLVVPISIFIEEKTRNIIGFLCVDNKEGNLNNSSNIEFMFAVGDLFYSFFCEIHRIN